MESPALFVRVPDLHRALQDEASLTRKPLRPLRGLQETRVATREESGVLGFPSRRGLSVIFWPVARQTPLTIEFSR